MLDCTIMSGDKNAGDSLRKPSLQRWRLILSELAQHGNTQHATDITGNVNYITYAI